MGETRCARASRPGGAEVETIATDAAEAITEPGATRDTVEAAIDDGLEATETLLEDLRGAVPPDTPEGDEAKAAVDAFLDDVSSANDEVESALADLPEARGWPRSSPSSPVSPTNLQTTIESGRTLVTELDGARRRYEGRVRERRLLPGAAGA